MTAHAQAHPHAHGHAAPAPAVASGALARAVVFEEPGRIALRDVALRVAAPDEVTVATAYSSISSGTERLVYAGRLPGFPQLRFPLVPGYEAAGTVVAAGEAVTGVAVGDEVFVGGSMCYVDAFGVFGGNASHLIKRASQVVPLHGIPLASAPLLALAATALHGVVRLGEVRGRRVIVLGMGAIGQFAARFLALRGAVPICCDVAPARLALAPGERVDLSRTTLTEAVVDADACIEATGDSKQIAVCAPAIRSGGAIVLLSYYETLETPYVDLFTREVSLFVAREWAHEDLLAARDAIASGALAVGELGTHIVPVAAYDAAYHTAFHDPSVLKVILQWA